MTKIILTGPESSGKTTLCKLLSKHFKITFAKEYAREYLHTRSRNYNQNDLVKIANEQLKLEQENTILDTDLITIKIWSNFKYGSCDKWILEQIQKQKFEERFYLLCKPDILWENDLLRENPKNRMEIFKIYKKELKNLNHNYYIIEGDDRNEKAIAKILSQRSII